MSLGRRGRVLVPHRKPSKPYHVTVFTAKPRRGFKQVFALFMIG